MGYSTGGATQYAMLPSGASFAQPGSQAMQVSSAPMSFYQGRPMQFAQSEQITVMDQNGNYYLAQRMPMQSMQPMQAAPMQTMQTVQLGGAMQSASGQPMRLVLQMQPQPSAVVDSRPMQYAFAVGDGSSAPMLVPMVVADPGRAYPSPSQPAPCQ